MVREQLLPAIAGAGHVTEAERMSRDDLSLSEARSIALAAQGRRGGNRAGLLLGSPSFEMFGD